MATKGRSKEVREFLNSLKKQRYTNFEVLIVDQNDDNRLISIVDAYKNLFSIKYLRSKTGVSRARNIGLNYASGDIVCFPDDDCQYSGQLLKRISEFFSKNKDYDGLSARTTDWKGNDTAAVFKSNGQVINKNNLWSSHNEVGLFLRKNSLKQIGEFDESMGVGAYFASSEGTDLVIRLLKNGKKIFCDYTYIIYHPQISELSSSNLKRRGVTYGRGVGRLIRKHQSFFGIRDKVKVFVGPMIKIFLKPSLKSLVFNISTTYGRVEGYLRS